VAGWERPASSYQLPAVWSLALSATAPSDEIVSTGRSVSLILVADRPAGGLLKFDAQWAVRLACKVEAMNSNPAISRLYFELAAHLIDREIAKFRRGEKATLVSFTNMAKLCQERQRRAHGPWHVGA
jgi:hypothetical protein